MLGFLDTMNDFLSTQNEVMQAYLTRGRRQRFRRTSAETLNQAPGSGRFGNGNRDEGSSATCPWTELTIPWPRTTRWGAVASRLWTRRGKGCRSCRSA